MVQTYYAKINGKLQQIDSMTEASWIHIEKPSQQEITDLAEHCHFPKDYLSAVLDNDETPRHEGLHQKELTHPVLLLLLFPHEDLGDNGFRVLQTYPFSIIFTSDKLITASNVTPVFLEKVRTLENDLGDNWLNQITLTLLWEIALCYNHYVKEIKHDIAELEVQIKITTENRLLYKLMEIQKSLIFFKGALDDNISILSSLYHTSFLSYSQQEAAYLHDVMVENKQALASTKIQLQLISQISDIFSSIVSNNLNIVMKVLTSLTLVLTIPTIIVGLYGMNIPLPLSDRPEALLIICLITIGLCAIVVRWLKKKNYF